MSSQYDIIQTAGPSAAGQVAAELAGRRPKKKPTYRFVPRVRDYKRKTPKTAADREALGAAEERRIRRADRARGHTTRIWVDEGVDYTPGAVELVGG